MATHKLIGPQKAAILLLTLGEEAAAEVLRHLDDNEVRQVTRFMTHFEDVTPRDVERVCNEYFVRSERKPLPPVPPETKSGYLGKVLGKALGDERGRELVDGVLAEPPRGALEKLQWHAPGTIAGFIAREHPQVIAVILASMDEPGLADKVLAHLPDEDGADVAARMARLGPVSADRLAAIEESLAEVMAAAPEREENVEGGTRKVAEVLASGSRSLEHTVMPHIEARDPELAGRIRERMLRFADFIRFDNPGLQKVLHRSTLADIALALKLADGELRDHVLANLTERTARQIREELDAMGPTRVAEVEAAQSRLITAARELIEQGRVVPLGKGVIP